MSVIKEWECNVYRDERGTLTNFFDSIFLQENSLAIGNVYLITFEKSGVIRGNHYHLKSSEVFCIICGKVNVIVRNILTGEEAKIELDAEDRDQKRILISENWAHAIQSISDFAVMASFSSAKYDPLDPDKHSYILI